MHIRLGEMVYPRGGWTRTFHYMTYRLRRLPDSPERIARGVWAGVFTTFTPFFGFHFFIAFFIARLMRGNIGAAILSTFVGNPITFVPIGVISLETGYWLLRMKGGPQQVGQRFVDAWQDLKTNFWALFTDDLADWTGLAEFYHEIFYPYMIGGLIPGVLFASLAYYLTVPLIRAYKNRRIAQIKAKFEAIKEKAAAEADLPIKAD